MKWDFLYQITAGSRIPDEGATAPRSPFCLSFVVNWICWTPPEQNSWVRHCSDTNLNVSVSKKVFCARNVRKYSYACAAWITARREGMSRNGGMTPRICNLGTRERWAISFMLRLEASLFHLPAFSRSAHVPVNIK